LNRPVFLFEYCCCVSIFADIVALESLQPQGLDNNLSLQPAGGGFPPNPLGGFIEVKEASLHNTLNEMQPLDCVERQCQNMA
jgi:hypothetical protein